MHMDNGKMVEIDLLNRLSMSIQFRTLEKTVFCLFALFSNSIMV